MAASDDLAHLLVLSRDSRPSMLAAAYVMATRLPKAAPLRRGLARAGHRGALLGLHLVTDVVLVDVLEHQPGDPTLPVGCIVATVFGGDDTAAHEIPLEHSPPHVNVITIWRPARPWHRLRAWWRELTWRPPT